MVWLDLDYAYGSAPHQPIHIVLNFFHMPLCIQSLVVIYFNNFHVCYTTQEIAMSVDKKYVCILSIRTATHSPS